MYAKQPLFQAFMELFVQARSNSLAVADAGSFTAAGWERKETDFFFDRSSVDNILMQEFSDIIHQIVPQEHTTDMFS